MKKVGLLCLAISLTFILFPNVQAQDGKENHFSSNSEKIEAKAINTFLIKKAITTIIIVRHAEKETCLVQQDQTCPLTADGEKRAETLARMLDKSGASVVFSTNTTRTKETVNNYANPRGVKIEIYKNPADMAGLIKSDYKGKTVLVVGHSPAIPEVMKSLGISSPPQIKDDFDNLFILTINADNKSSMVHLKYSINHALY